MADNTAHKFLVDGGRRLRGEIPVSGAKNSVLKLMAAALLTDEAVQLTNVPQLSDVDVMGEVVENLGVKVTQSGSQMTLEARDITTIKAPYELVSKMRASFNVLAGLLGRCGEAKVALPGGCSIGKRGIDLHVKGLQALGAEVTIDHGYVHAQAKKLTGADIVLDTPSVGATENIMVAAVLAEGTTTLSNAAQEPEIADLANFLNAMGADISGAGTNDIIIQGVKRKQLHGVEYSVVPDRIVAATYLVAAAATHGDVTLLNVIPAHVQAVLYKLAEMGADITYPNPNMIKIVVDKRLQAASIVTQPHPGFPTDMQAPLMALQSTADGVSIIKETIYENRFRQIGELKRMGAQIEQDGNVAVVTGVPELSGAPVKASDLRAGAALVIAALQAKGYSEITDLHHIDRGYEHLEQHLTSLGASIKRLPVEDADLAEAGAES